MWAEESVFYQIYPRSFHDTNGDGIGDLRGIIEKLDYLNDLGIKILFLSPIVESQSNHRYDSANYLKVDFYAGTMDDLCELCAESPH